MTETVDEHNLRERLTAFGDHELDDAQAATLWAELAQRPDGGAAAVRWLAEQQRLGVAGRRALAGEPTNETLRARIESMCCVEEMVARERRAAADEAADEAAAARTAARPSERRWRLPGLSLAAAAGLAIGLTFVAWRGGSNASAAVLPATLVSAVDRIHAECSRLPARLHDARFEAIDAPLAALARADLKSAGDAPDLTSIGFDFVGAGPCPASSIATVHLLYRSSKPDAYAAVSLFVQTDAGQFPGLKAGEVFRASSPGEPFPLLAWRSGKVIYFLVADDDRTEAAALQVLRPSATRPNRSDGEQVRRLNVTLR